MKLLIFIFLVSNLIARISKLDHLAPGKRDDGYRIWIYFDERDQERFVNLDPASIKRRKKHGITELTEYDYNIKQSYLDAVKKTGVIIKNKSHWLNAVSVFASKEHINLIQNLPFGRKV